MKIEQIRFFSSSAAAAQKQETADGSEKRCGWLGNNEHIIRCGSEADLVKSITSRVGFVRKGHGVEDGLVQDSASSRDDPTQVQIGIWKVEIDNIGVGITRSEDHLIYDQIKGGGRNAGTSA